jgi:hypothetical protein
MSGQRHAPAALPPRNGPGTHFTGGYVILTASLDVCGKPCPTGSGSLELQPRGESLHRLCYPGSPQFIFECKFLFIHTLSCILKFGRDSVYRLRNLYIVLLNIFCFVKIVCGMAQIMFIN